MDPIFENISQPLPAPLDNADEPLQLQVTFLDYNDYVGRIGVGRVSRGTIKVGQQVTVMKKDGSEQSFRVRKLFGFMGLERKEIEKAESGDIVAVSGMEDLHIGETICSLYFLEPLPILRIVDTSLKMIFLVIY